MSDSQTSMVFHKNLNRHGYGFHYRVLHEVERLYNERKSYWRFEAAEFPVEVQGHGTRIDFVLSSNSKSIYLLAECKRADPALKDWCFARVPYVRRRRVAEPYIADCVKLIEPTIFPSVRPIPPLPPRDQWPVSAAPVVVLPMLTEAFHIGLEVKGQQKGNSTGGGKNAIEEALTQVCRGLNGMIEFFSQNPMCLKEGDMVVLIPVIFTTAQLWVSDVDLRSTALTTGEIDPSKATLSRRDWVYFQYPLSPGLKHSINQPNNTALSIAGALDINFIRTIPIIHASAIEKFLVSLDLELSDAQYGSVSNPH